MASWSDVFRIILNLGHHTMATVDTRYQEINHSSTVAAAALLGREKIVTPELKLEHDEKSADGGDARMGCAICFVHHRNVVFMPCRHIMTCNTCALQLAEQHGTCPYCRQTIESATNVRFP
jgi:hypothetical protein